MVSLLLSLVLFVLIVLGFTSFMHASPANIPPTEMNALHEFYNSTNGGGWRWRELRGQHWSFGEYANPCVDQWQGINCTYNASAVIYHISGISLARYNLSGILPSGIKHLPELIFIILEENQIGGSIPPEITELSHLQTLRLSVNNFNSSIPHSIGQLNSLTSMDLSNNHLSGSIPDSIGYLAQLEELTFIHNHLTERIPSTIGMLSNLRTLLLDDNKLTGQLPATIGNLSSLRVLEIQINELSGTLPPSLGNLAALTGLGLSENKLTGTLPAELSGLTSALQIDIEANFLHGAIPASLGALHRLQSLDLFDNRLSHSIPDTFWNLSELVFFGVSQNDLTGPVPRCVRAMTSLQSLYLHDNDMTGLIPEYLGELQFLQEVYLQNNYFEGSIPQSVCNLTLLKDVDVGNNYMIGTIPNDISNVSTLETFVVDHNFLTGQIGHLFDPHTQLKLNSIQLNDNQLTGEFPPEIFVLPGLVSLVAGSNCFHGTLSDSVCAANQLYSLVLDGMSSATSCRDTIFPRISASYRLTRSVVGTIPSCVFSLPILTTLHLSGNGLTGTLPPNITIPTTLTDLVLSHNVLTGTIPANFQTRPWYSLDLSYNRLSGEFDPAFPCQTLVVLSEEELTSKYTADNSSVYLYNNFLSGVIPTCLKSYDQISILGTNLFSCDVLGHELPPHDTDRGFYECDSTLFNYSYYIWLGVWMVFGVLVLAAVRSRSLMCVAVKLHVDTAQRYFYYCGERLTVLDSLLRISVGTCLFVLVVLLPLYCVLSERYGTLMHQYAWTTSAGYLTGRTPVACLFVFWVLLLTVVLVVFRRMIQRYGTRLKSVSAFEPHSPLVYLIFISVSIFIVLGVNIAYVYVAIYRGSALFVLCQIIMSFFKLLWNNIVSFNVLHMIVHKISPKSVYRESDYATLLQVMALINTIVIPCLVVLTINPQCFYNVYVPAPAVSSRYLYQYCFITGPRGDCAVYIPKSATTSFTPPFIYSFQCSSSFITYYAPAFVNMCLISAFVGPALQYAQMRLAYRLHADSFWHKFLVRLLPPILKPLPRSTIEGEAAPVPNPPYFHSTRITTSILCWIGLLFTFGAVFPPLAVALTVTIFANMAFVKVKVGRFLSAARALGLHGHVDVVEKECRNLGSASVLRTSLWLLITISCWFYTLFLFDTLGSAVGFEASYWVLIVMPLMPLFMYILFKCAITMYRRYDTTTHAAPAGSIDSKDGAPVGFELHRVFADKSSNEDSTTFNAILSNK